MSDESPLANHRLSTFFCCILMRWKGFSGGSVVKNLPASAEDAGLSPGSGRSPGVGSYLEYLRLPWFENGTR